MPCNVVEISSFTKYCLALMYNKSNFFVNGCYSLEKLVVHLESCLFYFFARVLDNEFIL